VIPAQASTHSNVAAVPESTGYAAECSGRDRGEQLPDSADADRVQRATTEDPQRPQCGCGLQHHRAAKARPMINRTRAAGSRGRAIATAATTATTPTASRLCAAAFCTHSTCDGTAHPVIGSGTRRRRIHASSRLVRRQKGGELERFAVALRDALGFRLDLYRGWVADRGCARCLGTGPAQTRRADLRAARLN
jgi:hypothetical protein